jgi:DNA-directed RNA polymerase specialized sigma24 family protein
MFRREKTEIAGFRADYADRSDFCQVFEREMQSFYLLAFLLTANHEKAEQVFALTLEQALKEQSVFKDWAQPWIKHSLIKNAIGIVSPASASYGGERELWSAAQPAMAGEEEINAVTFLPPLQRFVFVMSILERYSLWECSVLLGCGAQKVARSRMRSLRGLPRPAQFLPRSEARLPYFMEALT